MEKKIIGTMDVTEERRLLILQLVTFGWENGGVRTPTAADEIKAMMQELQACGLRSLPRKGEAGNG